MEAPGMDCMVDLNELSLKNVSDVHIVTMS